MSPNLRRRSFRVVGKVGHGNNGVAGRSGFQQGHIDAEIERQAARSVVKPGDFARVRAHLDATTR